MQNVINSVKGTALGVAEYLIPVLKVGFLLSTVLYLTIIVVILVFS